MTVYATRLANGLDTAERMRRSDSLYLFPAGATLARSGLRPDGGGAVTVNSGTMTVTVEPFTAWIDGGASDAQGGYPFVLDASLNLTIDPGHATLARVDTVVAQVRDDVFDGSGFTDARVYVVKGDDGGGAPAVPQSAIPLRDINVPAGASAGTGGLALGDLGADRRQYVTGLGGVLPVASQAERDAFTARAGQMVYRADKDRIEWYSSAGWKGDTDFAAIPLASGFTTELRTPQYAIRGGLMVFRGAVKPTTGTFGTSATIGTLPEGSRPPQTVLTMVQGPVIGEPIRVIVSTTGTIDLTFAASGSAYASLDSVFFPLS